MFHSVFISFVIMVLAGCNTIHLTSLGDRVENFDRYEAAFIEEPDFLYVSYLTSDDGPVKRNARSKLETDSPFEETDRIPSSAKNIPIYKDVPLDQINEAFNTADGVCPIIVEYVANYSHGNHEYFYILIDNCVASKQFLLTDSIPVEGKYKAWWFYPVVTVGIVPALAVDIVTLPFQFLYGWFKASIVTR